MSLDKLMIELKHLQGQHSQQSHAGSKGGSSPTTGMNAWSIEKALKNKEPIHSLNLEKQGHGTWVGKVGETEYRLDVTSAQSYSRSGALRTGTTTEFMVQLRSKNPSDYPETKEATVYKKTVKVESVDPGYKKAEKNVSKFLKDNFGVEIDVSTETRMI